VIQLVLFDIDGTLISTSGAGEKAFARVCELEFGVADGTRDLHFAGRTDPAIVREFFQKHEIPATTENFTRFFDAYVFLLEERLQQVRGHVLPGVGQLISAFQGRLSPPVIGLLTGNIRLGAQIKLKHYGLWQHFVMGAFGDDHESRDHLASVARERGSKLLSRKLAGEEILVIGDTPADVQCGKAIGAKVLAVATGKYQLPELHCCRPTWATGSLADCCADEICA
jgi:phosphoglycolate phosphatase-like HAD superfamily hydrolase